MYLLDLSNLRTRFGIPGVLSFDEHNGLMRLHVSTAEAQATLYLQGAHLTHWQPAKHDPVIFLSRESAFAPGMPIRGGIPIAFPWFASDAKRDRIDGHPGPAHGFARIQDWTLLSAEHAAPHLVLKFSLAPTAMSRSLGFDAFGLTLEVSIGPTLTMQLTVTNPGPASLSFEEAFHTFFSVVEVHEATVTGLEPTPYFDKTDNMQLKPASGAPISFSGPVDRMYQGTEAPCTIHDGAQRRDIHIVKTNSRTTVVWNPARALPDLGEWDWHEMLCVETVNAGANARTVEPGGSFTMRALISVERWKPGTTTG